MSLNSLTKKIIFIAILVGTTTAIFNCSVVYFCMCFIHIKKVHFFRLVLEFLYIFFAIVLLAVHANTTNTALIYELFYLYKIYKICRTTNTHRVTAYRYAHTQPKSSISVATTAFVVALKRKCCCHDPIKQCPNSQPKKRRKKIQHQQQPKSNSQLR